MIDPPTQNRKMSLARRWDDGNFRYLHRNDGTMLADTLDYTFRLRSFARSLRVPVLGVIVVPWLGLTVTVLMFDILKKMVHAMGLRDGESESKQRREGQRETLQPKAFTERLHLLQSILTGYDATAQGCWLEPGGEVVR